MKPKGKLRKELRLQLFEKMVVSRKFEAERDEITRHMKQLQN
jgi:hypothetical protein